MLITVEAKGPFGVRAAEDKSWKSFQDKQLKDSLVVGKQYEITLAPIKCEDGKTRKQVVKAVEAGGTINVQETVKAAAPVSKAAAPQVRVETKSGLGFAEKDERILVQGLTQALLQSSEMQMRGDDEPFDLFVEERVHTLVGIVKKLSKIS